MIFTVKNGLIDLKPREMNSTGTKTSVLVCGAFMTRDASARAAEQRLGLFFVIASYSF